MTRFYAKDGFCEELQMTAAQMCVFLDDLEVQGCIGFDTEEGWVQVSIPKSRMPGEFETRYGRVKILRNMIGVDRRPKRQKPPAAAQIAGGGNVFKSTQAVGRVLRQPSAGKITGGPVDKKLLPWESAMWDQERSEPAPDRFTTLANRFRIAKLGEETVPAIDIRIEGKQLQVPETMRKAVADCIRDRLYRRRTWSID